MYKLFNLLSIIVLFFQNVISQENSKFYGEMFSISELEDYSSLRNDIMTNYQRDIKIEGEILSSCPMKGCWMKIKSEQDTILVRFKDYGFFVPKKGIEGDKAIVHGKMSVETLSIDLLRHYAEDAGKTEEEINDIKEPKVSFTFLADGVYIKNL